MAKRLEEFLKPASKGDATFMALHKVKANGLKKPDVATKTYKRKEDRMGYDSPEDEEAYRKAIGEDTVVISEASKKTKAFKHVAVGETFTFQGEHDHPYSGIAKGPWVKTGNRSYRHSDEDHHIKSYGKSDNKVGTVQAKIHETIGEAEKAKSKSDVMKASAVKWREHAAKKKGAVKEDTKVETPPAKENEVVVEYTINDIQQQMVKKHGTVDQEALKKLRTLGHGRYKKEHLAQIGQESLFEGVDYKETIVEGMSPDAHELMLHGDNDSQLHRQSHMPIIKNLQRKIKSGKYDHEKAKKLWGYKATAAAQSYTKTYGEVPSGRKSSVGTFTKKTRDEVAGHWADREHASIMNGEYGDDHIPKQKGKPIVKEDTLDETMNVHDKGDYFGVTVSPDHMHDFKSHWPASGLSSKPHYFEFHKKTGDLVDVEHPGSEDGHALAALADDAKQHGARKLGLHHLKEDKVDESSHSKEITKKDDRDKNGYSRDSVDKAISSSKKKIGGKEAKMIHALLKGRH